MTLTAQDACKMNRDVCEMAPIVPVLVIKDASKARPLAEALVAGGLPALEVTLRTPAALDAIKAMSEIPGGVVGAGTLITPDDVKAAKAAGAKFGVSPGATDALIQACEDEELPLLAGAVTASEVMRMLEKGYDLLKFFPAGTSGGAPAIKAIGGPLPQATFCPTGGITPANAMEYLMLPNVICAGGSWVAPAPYVEDEKWWEIEKLAREASRMGR